MSKVLFIIFVYVAFLVGAALLFKNVSTESKS